MNKLRKQPFSFFILHSSLFTLHSSLRAKRDFSFFILHSSFFILLLSALSAKAQTEVAQFRPGVTPEGVNYFLPQTRLEVVVVAEKTVVLPGDFAAYADRYLRLKDVPAEEQTEWELKSISLHPYGIPDPDKAYSIRLRAKTAAPLVSLTEDGLLLAINAEAAPEPLPQLPNAVPAPAPLQPRDFMTQEILAAGNTAKMAQLTADEIYDIRESRNAILRGEADNTPKDGQQLRLMLEGLERQENALLALFRGQRLTSTEVFTFDFDPAADTTALDKPQLLCRFSRRLGLVATDDLSGEPVWITIKSLHNLPQTLNEADGAKKKARSEQGVYVNLPLRTRIDVFTATKSLATLDVPIAQWGTVEVLSEALFNKLSDTRVRIHQHTGSVREITGH